MSRLLFVMLHPGFVRYYEDALYRLAAAGHDVHVAFEISRDKLGEHVLAQRLAAAHPRLTCGTTPPRGESVRDFLARGDRAATRSAARGPGALSREGRIEAWDSLATTVRVLLDYLRFFEPAFARAGALRARAQKRVPRAYRATVERLAASSAGRRFLHSLFKAVEQVTPPNPILDEFVSRHRPDLLLVTPLIELGSQQVDYVKSARRLGVRSALCVASWDNLTSKGLIRVAPDHVIVWNEAQKAEAVAMHGIRPDRVVVTGAQPFDRWFDARPSRTRGEFCRAAGLDPDRPFVLYVGSSSFIAPDEVPFAERWIARLRSDGDPGVAGVGVLVRPHPANARQWRTFEPAAFANAAVWPPIGSDPNAPTAREDYFDSLYHSAAVVGINTSAQLEAGIVGRPVFTVRAAEFEHAQAGTLHFQHLVNPDAGLVSSATTLDEHAAQLRAALEQGCDAAAANRRFVRSFIRPFGEEVAATPAFVGAVSGMALQPPPPAARDRWWTAAARPGAFVLALLARQLAEDRPLWVYALRPGIGGAVWAAAGAHWLRAVTRDTVGRLTRLGREARRVRYEIAKRTRTLLRRTRKALARRVRQVGGAARRAIVRRGHVPAGAERKNV